MQLVTAVMLLAASLLAQNGVGGVVSEQELDPPGGAVSRPATPARPVVPPPAPVLVQPTVEVKPAAPAPPVPVQEATPVVAPDTQKKSVQTPSATPSQATSGKPVAAFWVVLPESE